MAVTFTGHNGAEGSGCPTRRGRSSLFFRTFPKSYRDLPHPLGVQGLYVGDSEQLTATVLPDNATDKTLIWSSDNAAVATVDADGHVTAISVGTAVIKAESVSNPGVFDSCTVTVESSTVAVTSVSVSPATLELTVGDAYTLSATVNPSNATNKNVTWSSSNESVASVSSYGTVTAKAAGTAVIKAASSDGPYGTCTVTVKAKPITVTLSPVSLTVIGGTSEKLTATISPSNAENTTLIWKTTNSTIIKLNTVETSVTTYGSTASITVFGSMVGEADVTVAAADNPSKILATCHVTVPSSYIQHLYFKDVQGKTINLKVGNTYRLKVIYEPKDADPVHLKWGYTSSHLSIIDFNGLDEVTVQAKKSNATDGATVRVYAKDEDGHCSEEAICYFKITE